MDVCGFRVEHIGSHRTTWRRFKIWVTTYDEMARSVNRWIQKGDWLLISGSMYARPWKGGQLYFKDGTPVTMPSTELWAHNLELIQRPLHDYKGDDIIPVPREEYLRFKAFQASESRWDVPRDHHADLLKNSDLEQIVEQETQS